MDEKSAAEYEAWINECYSEVGSAESWDYDVRKLLTVARKKLEMDRAGLVAPSLDDELEAAIEAVEAWYEETDDPRANGLVDYKGRP